MRDPSRTLDIRPVPVVTPGSSAPIPPHNVFRPCLPGARPPDMVVRPCPHFFERFSAVPTGQIALSVCEMWSGSTPGRWRIPSRCLHKKRCLYPQLSMSLFCPPSPVVHSPDRLSLCRLPRLIIIAVFPPHCPRYQLLPVADHYSDLQTDYGVWKRVPLCHASLPAEVFSIVPPCLCHHMKARPVSL